MVRLFINFGKMDKMFPNKLIELINKCVPGRVRIGKIDLLPRFSFFDVEEAEAATVVESMNQYEVEGRRISVEYADRAETGKGRDAKAPKGRRSSSDRPKPQRRAQESWDAGERKAGKKRRDTQAPFYEKYKGKKNR